MSENTEVTLSERPSRDDLIEVSNALFDAISLAREMREIRVRQSHPGEIRFADATIERFQSAQAKASRMVSNA